MMKKQSEELLIRRFVKTTIQGLYNKGSVDNYHNAAKYQNNNYFLKYTEDSDLI